MKIIKSLLTTTLALVALTASAGGDWVSMFNGKDLSGWRSNEETPGVFTIQDGVLKVSGGRAHLFYVGSDGKASFKNFEFKAKVMTKRGANSGIYFHTKFQKDGWPWAGYECQVNSTHSDHRKTGSLYAVKDVNPAPSKDDQWFDYYIKVEGRHITVKIDGKTTVDWTEPADWDPTKSLQGMDGRKLSEGTFALQGHDPDSTVYFKDMHVRALPAVAAGKAAQKKVLVVTVTAGFRHESIKVAEKVLAELAEKSGEFSVDFVRQPEGAPPMAWHPGPPKNGPDDPEYKAAVKRFEDYKTASEKFMPKFAEALRPLSPDNLAKYDAVIFASTTGDLPLPDKMGFLKWIASGKGFIGMHAATDTFHGYPAFVEMIGGEFQTHGPQVPVECINDDPAHPATKMLPARMPIFDEIYEFKNFDRATVHSLLSMDKHPQSHAAGYNPVAWCKRYGTGRVFYTSLGHRNDVWDPEAKDDNERKNPAELAKLYQQHILGGIRWALGLAAGDDKPQFTK